jgi:branched-chain amino acid transport system permease protein
MRAVAPACWLALLLLGLLFPVLLPGQPYLLQVLTLALCTMVPAVGLNLLYGYTGLLSLGHMGFAGVGAYTGALLMLSLHLPAALALLAAALLSAFVGLLVGLPCLRLRSHFFVIVTLGVGMILFSLFNNLDWLTGGAAGLPGVQRPAPLALGFGQIGFRTAPQFYRLVLLVAALVFLLQWAVVRSAFGRSLRAIRQDERMAAARGVDVFAHKLAVFALSAGIAGVGGALQVMFLRVAAPDSFDLAASINLVAVVILGGAGYLAGPILGALLFIALPEALQAAPQSRLMIFGAVLVLLALFAPRGCLGLLAAARRRLLRRREPDAVPA